MHKTMSVLSRVIAASIVLVLTAGIASAAMVTQSISYQGKLTDAAGNPLTGSYSVTFKLYDVASGGTALATDTHSVTATSGLFTTTIATNPAVIDGRALWLGIKVGSDAEMTPRQEIRPVPYALGLRPGAVITGDAGSNPSLKVINTGTNVAALIAGTTGTNSPALFANALGASPAVYALSPNDIGVYGNGKTGAYFTSNQGGTGSSEHAAVNVTTVHDFNPGIGILTTGAYSEGVSILNKNIYSDGVYITSNGQYGGGVNAHMREADSVGLQTVAYSGNSYGVVAIAEGADSYGVLATTTNTNSPAVYATASAANSRGIYAKSQQSEGIVGDAVSAAGVKGYSTNKAGVWGLSDNDVGLYGDTVSGTYGVFTNDKMYAGAGIDAPNVDVAEFMPVAGDAGPGTVLVIGKGGVLSPSAKAYDTRVAGIVSTEPGVSLGTKEGGNPGEALIAVAGKVPCKVDASNGPIHPGDLLTTSGNTGYAMKATHPQIGTVLGKAMGTLESGTGTIEVIVTLQ
jgi:hypothetical protein